MRVVGIIAEYNPLHNGHIYHLEQAKAQTGAEYCIVVMSGNFVQRGEPACTDKFTRTEWALKAGADLVLELPSIYAVSSAERFALGGVRTLFGTGVVTDLAFGCEEPDLSTLYQLADILTTEPPAFQAALHEQLKLGKSYPRARFEALANYGVPDNMLEAIVQPNNILAIEYLHAIGIYAPSIQPQPITRIGCGYNSENLTGEISSATAIRLAIKQGNRDVLNAMPSFVGGALFYDDNFVISQSSLSDMMLYAIRTLRPEDLMEIPEVNEGFENVLYKAARSVNHIEVFYDTVKSKRYTLARVKRIAVCALLGITADQIHATIHSQEGSYLRVLGFKKDARSLLSMIGKYKRIPMILRNSDIENCPLIVQRNLETDMLSTDLIAYATQREIRRDLSGAIMLE
ncbi:MAG: nucleotidyltransferase [Clostridia bacterium]